MLERQRSVRGVVDGGDAVPPGGPSGATTTMSSSLGGLTESTSFAGDVTSAFIGIGEVDGSIGGQVASMIGAGTRRGGDEGGPESWTSSTSSSRSDSPRAASMASEGVAGGGGMESGTLDIPLPRQETCVPRPPAAPEGLTSLTLDIEFS